MNFSKCKERISERQFYYLAYSVCFLITALVVFSWYFKKNDFLVWPVDGWAQHYKAMVYYSGYLRGIIKDILFQHKLIIPHYDFSIGEGSDILQTLHYYVIGDPFSVFCVFVPKHLMYLYYTAAILLRMYLSGIAFSALCFEMGNKSRYAVLTGSMAYVFCYWSILQAGKHPFFLNPMLYLPLLIMGTEKIIKGKRPYLFILTVAVSAMSNFYFFYVLAFLLVLYVIVRAIYSYHKNIKRSIILVLRIGADSALGVLLSAVILLPMCYVFLSDSRVSSTQPFHLFYPLTYYVSFPAAFLANIDLYGLCMCFAAPVLPAVFLMFYKRHKFTFMKILFIIGIVVFAFPFLGQALNGFAYMSNRWCFAYALVTSYILTIVWPDMMCLKTREAAFLVFCTTVYFAVCLFLEDSRSKQVFSAIVLCMLVVFVLFPTFKEELLLSYKRKQQLILLTVLVSVVLNSFWKNSVSEGDDARGMGRYIGEILNANETSAVASAADYDGMEDFYRFSGENLTTNANMIAGMSSTQYYWSLSNPQVAEYRRDLNMPENVTHSYTGYDGRAALNALASVRYYSVPENDLASAPYGFTQIDTLSQSAYIIYRNDYSLPFSFSYDSYVTMDAWESLSTMEKQETMLQSVVLTEDAVYSKAGTPIFSSSDITYTITCNSDEVSMQDNSFVVTRENASVTISFDGMPYSETYLEIDGLEFQGSSKYDLYFGDEKFDPLNLYDEVYWDMLGKSSQSLIQKERWLWSSPTYVDLTYVSADNRSKQLRYYSEDHSNYANRHSFSMNLGYTEEPISSVEISFSDRGIYSFDSIKITCQPMKFYAEQIELLRKNTLYNVMFGTDTITGEITLDEPKILCLSIPYSTGWSARVDGRETKLYQANVQYIALDLDAGAHTIELTYETPLLRLGVFLSLFGSVIFIIYMVIYERKLLKK